MAIIQAVMHRREYQEAVTLLTLAAVHQAAHVLIRAEVQAAAAVAVQVAAADAVQEVQVVVEDNTLKDCD